MKALPFLSGAACVFLFIPICCEWFDYSAFDDALWRICGTLAAEVGMLAHMAVAALIARACMSEKRAVCFFRAAVGSLIACFGCLVFLLAVNGVTGLFMAWIYDGGSRLEYFQLELVATLCDLRILFFWLCAFSLVASAKKSAPQTLYAFCFGSAAAILLALAGAVAIGRSSISMCFRWHSMPERTSAVIAILFGMALICCGVRTAAAPIIRRCSRF